jgi:hypothetical protein
MQARNRRRAKTRTSPGFKDRALSWLIYTGAITVLPLFIAYFAQPAGVNPFETVLARGDAFILTVAIIAPELGEIQATRKTGRPVGHVAVQGALFLILVVSTCFFVIATANFSATHPEIDTASTIQSKGPDGTIKTSITAGRPVFEQLGDPALLSLAFLFAGGVLVLVSIFDRTSIPVHTEIDAVKVQPDDADRKDVAQPGSEERTSTAIPSQHHPEAAGEDRSGLHKPDSGSLRPSEEGSQ